ncbi:hypothetical protein AVEN_105598-1 [Araneus ventricosus]|uniref:Integrase catalytic domain-containing protein n=1 Tax=Araneus ventricosus TaxID=182803 RepID=A0A4Y2Q8B2_ARAVE|nr:hypothetical protein AVEN_105598-1 [Araneus ventricosus]
MIDRFTRWLEAAAMSGMEAETVARAFVNTWVSRFGTLRRLTFDRGGKFELGLFETLSKLLGVHLTRTASYTPQCNGMVERLHRPLKQALTCQQANWLDALPLVLLVFRLSCVRISTLRLRNKCTDQVFDCLDSSTRRNR